MQKPVAHKQSLFDFAIQHCGTVNAVLAIAVANNVSLTAEIEAGTLLTIPVGILTDQDIVAYYTDNKIVPATAITQLDGITDGSLGIGQMRIEETFKVY